jgi:transposase
MHGTDVETVAGIDIGKTWLDVALTTSADCLRVRNDGEGHAAIVAFLRRHGVHRVGLEATGGYETALWAALSEAGFVCVVFQPRQVRAYARFRLNRAKSDKLDAKLIEQIEEDLARAQVRREHLTQARLIALQNAEIARLKAVRRAELKLLRQAVKAHPDLARRYALLFSIDGIGERTALALIIRMPELGSLTRQEAASLLGVAPFVHQSGRYQGQRRIGGGRARPRRSLFAAAQAACQQWNKPLIALYNRLLEAGKPHVLAVVACARKLLIFANAVLARGTPWQTAPR